MSDKELSEPKFTNTAGSSLFLGRGFPTVSGEIVGG